MRAVIASALITSVVACVATAYGAQIGMQVGASEERRLCSAKFNALQAEHVARMGKTDREWSSIVPVVVSR